jgi:uncharacterized protein with ParB-like and HNH nuclease domain
MQTGKNTIEGIFDATRIFNVPIYQRAYSWERKLHLSYFLSDLINQPTSADRSYFFGSFLFHLNGKRAEFQLIDIVDGQQRLTTFIIFMKVLISELKKRNSAKISERTIRKYIKDEDVYKLELENEDSSFLHNYVLSDKSTRVISFRTPSQRLLIDAKLYFSEELSRSETDVLERIYDVATKADVLLYVVEKINTATQIFELLNDRGKKLTDIEGIKSFLMYNVGLVSNSPDQLIQNIQNNFGEIYRMIEAHNIDEDDVLRYHAIAFEEGYKTDTKPREFIKEKILTLIRNKNSDGAKDTIVNFSKSLKESFEIYKSIQLNEDNLPELDKLKMIGRVAPYFPVMMRVKKLNPGQFRDLVSNIIKFTFKAALVGLRSNGETALYTAIRDNEDLGLKVASITKYNWWNINVRAKEVAAYNNYFEWVNKNLIKYVLISYENKLRDKKGFALLGINDYFSEDSREKLNIEHISAQKAVGIEYDEDFNQNYMHNISNLVIDSTASNSSKRNDNTDDKKSALRNAPLMSQNEILEADCNWRDLDSIKKFITVREGRLKAFISKEFEL